MVRKHEINEGFLVTGMLFPLVLPATIPLWQVALGIAFGTLIGKEIFGGTGMNILNPALASRAFLFFGYPAAISGDKVWIAANTNVDGVSRRHLAGKAAAGGMSAVGQGISWMDAFLGTIPGSMGETSALACFVGAAFLILTGVGSWRIMFSVAAGSWRDEFDPERRRLGDQSAIRRALPLAHRAGRLGVRRGIHGHRSGERVALEHRPTDLRISHRRYWRSSSVLSTRPSRKA